MKRKSRKRRPRIVRCCEFPRLRNFSPDLHIGYPHIKQVIGFFTSDPINFAEIENPENVAEYRDVTLEIFRGFEQVPPAAPRHEKDVVLQSVYAVLRETVRSGRGRASIQDVQDALGRYLPRLIIPDPLRIDCDEDYDYHDGLDAVPF